MGSDSAGEHITMLQTVYTDIKVHSRQTELPCTTADSHNKNLY